MPVTEFEILKETPTTAVVDGHDGMGMIVGYKAMNMAIEKAKKYGMGMACRQKLHPLRHRRLLCHGSERKL